MICETAAQYTCREKQGTGETHTVQTACVTELVYTYDQDQNPETTASLTCPNCGAPVRKLGAKQCEYCESILKLDNLEIWKSESGRNQEAPVLRTMENAARSASLRAGASAPFLAHLLK